MIAADDWRSIKQFNLLEWPVPTRDTLSGIFLWIIGILLVLLSVGIEKKNGKRGVEWAKHSSSIDTYSANLIEIARRVEKLFGKVVKAKSR